MANCRVACLPSPSQTAPFSASPLQARAFRRISTPSESGRSNEATLSAESPPPVYEARITETLKWILGTVIVVLLGAAAEKGFGVITGLVVKPLELKRARQLVCKSTAKPRVPEDRWVQRDKVESAVRSYADLPIYTQAKYKILASPRGSGKSAAVLHALRDRPGTIVVTVQSDQMGAGHDVLVRAVTKQLGIDNHVTTREQFYDFLRSCQPYLNDRRVVIVVEVENDVSYDMMYFLGIDAKAVASDDIAARVILVTNDANVVFAIKRTEREEFVWVDDLTQEEANDFLDKRGVLIGDKATRQRLFECAGRRPLVLDFLWHDADEAHVESLILHQKVEARRQVKNLLGRGTNQPCSGDAFRRLLTDMLVADPDHGVPDLDVQDYLGSLTDVGKALKDTGYHAIMFHHPSQEYRFTNPSSRKAAEEELAERFSTRFP